MTVPVETTWKEAGSSVTSAEFLATQQKAYARFFETHVSTGVTDGMIASRSIDEAMKVQSAETAKFMKGFANAMGVDSLMFTKDGTWIIPPKMREAFPDYKRYLMEESADNQIVGTAAITFAQNQPIPTFDEDGKQIGGFENGDFHGYLTIVDNRTGKVLELHQTFLENSNDPAFRPGFVGMNEAYAKDVLKMSLDAAHAYLKDPNAETDSSGQTGGRKGSKYTRMAYVQCELVASPDEAFNWNDHVNGSNFNYVPIAALDFQMTERKMNALLWDRELAIRECGIKAKEGTTAKQNEAGFEPATRDGLYLDGTPRYVIPVEQMIDGELQTVFINASPDAHGNIPEGAIRVKEYDTVVAGKDMQVVKPYNHHGGSQHIADAANCFSSIAGMLDNVAAHNVIEQSVLDTLGVKKTFESGITRMLGMHMVKGALNSTLINYNMPVNGVERADLAGSAIAYQTKHANGALYNMIDFTGLTLKQGGMALLSGLLAQLGRSEGDPELTGVVGKAIAIITEQRQKAVEEGARPDESQLLILPVGTAGSILQQIHPHIYAANNNLQISLPRRIGRRARDLAARARAALSR